MDKHNQYIISVFDGVHGLHPIENLEAPNYPPVTIS